MFPTVMSRGIGRGKTGYTFMETLQHWRYHFTDFGKDIFASFGDHWGVRHIFGMQIVRDESCLSTRAVRIGWTRTVIVMSCSRGLRLTVKVFNYLPSMASSDIA